LADTNNDMVANGWRIVEKNQNRISDLVLDMLTFSKEREPNLAMADINAVIADVAELMQSRASDLNVKLDWIPDENIPPFLFDVEQIHRAVTNIVTNAIDAARSQPDNDDDPEAGIMLREGRVWVRTSVGETSGEESEPGDFNTPPSPRTPRPLVQIIIEDNGPGIPPEMVKALFRPFQSSKKGNGGTGLGLAVTHKIIEEHGGRLAIETASDGGARFLLELPIQQPEA
jgi:signal transduction histidine kinase